MVTEEDAPHYQKAVESASIGILCVAGNTGRYVFANEKFAEMIGLTHAELLASDPYQIANDSTHPDERVLSRQAIARIAAGEVDSLRYEKRLVRPDGAALWVTADLVATRDAAGRLAYLTLYFTDIHERRLLEDARERLESELRQAQKLEALGRLAGGVAHDFNNRLLVIMGYAELIRDGLQTDDALAENVEQVLESAQRASELTRQLLAYCRLQVIKPQVMDLNRAVERMRKLLGRLIGDDVELVTTLEATHPIVADSGQIEQAIINLAVNARDAMPRGGRLTLGTRDVVLGVDERHELGPGDYVELVVSDTGSGIPSEVRAHIFEPFFTTKELGRGTGLGLPTVQGIVRQSGGGIFVDSSPGRGSSFTLYLPRSLRKQLDHEQPEPRTLPLRLSRETVLVCDDDDAVRQLIVNVLRLRGYEVLSASSGEQALALAGGDTAIDLLVTDLVMPELDGLVLAAKLRERWPRMSVLFISGYTTQAAQLSGDLARSTQFLGKPFRPSDLTRTVCTLLEGAQSS